jgi:uncharacterized protein (TIGR00288 family)
MPNDVQPRIALLIDADNAPAEMIDEILTELSTFGLINIRRAYGNWTKAGLHGWQSKLLEYAVRPMQQFDYSKGKNATDMAMTVDAMELLYTEKPDAFGIVSSDADFTPLVMHLRAKGAAVYGFGAEQTPRAFVNACSRFLYFDARSSTALLPRRRLEAAANARAAAEAARAGDRPAAAWQAWLPEQCGRRHGAGPDARRCCLRTCCAKPQLIGMLRDAVKATQRRPAMWLRFAWRNKLSFARNYGYASLSKRRPKDPAWRCAICTAQASRSAGSGRGAPRCSQGRNCSQWMGR